MKKIYSFIVASIFLATTAYSQTLLLPQYEDFENETQGSTGCATALTITLNSTLMYNAPNATADDTEWSPDAGGTGSFNTGPTNPAVDHNPGTSTGFYMYIETSSGCGNGSNEAYLETNYMNWSTYNGVKFDFWYHMFGTTMGTMHVDARQGTGAWVLDIIPSWTDNQDLWQLRSISIFDSAFVNKDSVQLRIRGVVGTSFGSDMAIDDISIEPIVARNIGITDLTSPTFPFCAGATLPITIDVANGGTDTVTSFVAYRDINGSSDSVTFSGSLAPGDTTSITLGNYFFNGPGPYDVIIYTRDPNGMVDQATGNDTLRINGARTGLAAGNYTIDSTLGSTATNFISFSELANALTLYGVCGNVNVDVAAGDYSDELILGTIEGTGPSARVTINGGDTSLVSLSSPNIATTRATVVFNNTSYVTIKNMTILNEENTTSYDNYVIHFSDASNYDSLVGLNLIGNQTATFNSHVICSSSDITNEFSEGDNANWTTVMNCTFLGGDYSVRFEGQFNNWNVGNKFIGNTMTNMDDYGIYTDDQDSIEVIGNHISGFRTTSNFSGYGITLFDGMNFRVWNNEILAHYTGIYITNANSGKTPDRAGEIINNMIVAERNHGIWTTRANTLFIWYNSVTARSVGTGAFATDAAMMLDDGFGGPLTLDNIDLRNNIFVGYDSAAALIVEANDTIFTKFDNNVYNNSGSVFMRIDGTDYTDLAAVQAALPNYNSASLEGDPQFNSPNNLRIVGSFVNDNGDATVPVTVDIDGDIRPSAISTATDPGADEYDPPLCAPPVALGARDIASSTATIFWTTGGASGSYEYELVASGSGQGTGTAVASAVDTAALTGLTPYTLYDFFVREVCGRGDTSPWVGPSTFRTLCAPFTAPYYNGFENDPIDQVPGCWTELTSGYDVNADVRVQAFFGVNGPYQGVNALHFEPWFGGVAGVDTLAIISPQFTDMTAGDKQARFWTSSDDILNELYVGTIDVPNNTGSITWLDTITYPVIDVYAEAIVPITTLNGYNGSDQYLVFAHNLSQTFDDIRIDEFNYEVMPTCPKPQGLDATNLTSNSADLVWTSPSGGTSFEVEWDVAPFTQGTGNVTAVTGTSLTISGLTPATGYAFWVREICGANDTSVWNGPYNFNSLIQGPTGVNCITGNASNITTEEFDVIGSWTGDVSAANVIGDWNFGFQGQTGSFNTGPSGAHSGNTYAYVETSGSWNTNAVMVSPPFDLTQVTDSAELSFWLHMFGATMGTLNVGVSTSATGPFTNVFSWSGELQTALTDPFQQVGVRLDAYVGQTVYVEFDYLIGSSFTGDVAIDLLEITGCVSCAAPNTLVDSNLTAFTVDLGWQQNGVVPSWELEYGVAGFTPGTGTRQTVTTLPVSLTGLSQATAYDWYVRSICAPGDTSIWVNSSFETPCAPFTAPYFIDFETSNLNETPNCWSQVMDYNSNFANVWTRNFTGVNGPCFGSRALYIYPQTGFAAGGTDTLAAVSPEFSDMINADKRVRFWASVDDITVNLIVGTTDDPVAMTNVTNLDTLVFNAADVCQEFIVNIDTANGYNGTDKYVFLAHSLPSTGTFDYIRVDNFRYEDIPSCVRPSNLSSSNATLTSVDLDWVENNSATTWEIEYGTAGFVPGFGTTVIVTSKPHTLSGLTPSTRYEYYVRSICTPGDTSFWEGPELFGTAIGIPYTENWSGYTVGAVTTFSPGGWTSTMPFNPRWEVEDATGANENSLNTGPFYDNTSFGVAGGNYMYLETSGGFGQEDTLRSPSILIPTTAGPLDFSFFYHMYGASMGDLEVYIDSLGTLIGLDTISGQQHLAGGDPWTGDTIPMPAGLNGISVQIVFVGRSTTTFTSDMSIDDIKIDQAVSVAEITETINGLSIYPNPSKGLFNLSLNSNTNEAFRLTARDMSGKVVYEEMVTLNGVTRKQIDLSGLAKGVYTLQVQSGEKSKVEKLIIK